MSSREFTNSVSAACSAAADCTADVAVHSRDVHRASTWRLYRAVTMEAELESRVPDGAADSDHPPALRRRITVITRDVLLIVLVALTVSFLVKTFVIRPFYVPSASMSNTLQSGDKVIVSLLTPGLTPLNRGDVVVFRDPGGWLDLTTSGGVVSPPNILAFLGLTASNDKSHLVKRIIGLPGDTVTCCTEAGNLTVNGTPLTEPYILLPPEQTRADKYTFSVTVPKDSLWVLGDNRYDSADSAYRNFLHRANVFVPITAVVGRAVVINWPIGRWTYLDDYPATFGGVGHQQPAIVPQD